MCGAKSAAPQPGDKVKSCVLCECDGRVAGRTHGDREEAHGAREDQPLTCTRQLRQPPSRKPRNGVPSGATPDGARPGQKGVPRVPDGERCGTVMASLRHRYRPTRAGAGAVLLADRRCHGGRGRPDRPRRPRMACGDCSRSGPPSDIAGKVPRWGLNRIPPGLVRGGRGGFRGSSYTTGYTHAGGFPRNPYSHGACAWCPRIAVAVRDSR